MKRFVLLMVGILAALVVAAPTAFADRTYPPGQYPPYPIDETPMIFPAKGEPYADPYLSCEFPVSLVNSGLEKDVGLSNGLFIIEAGRFVTLTNLDTGKQVTVNSTGTYQMMQLEDGFPYLTKVTLTGTNIAGLPELGFVVLKGDFTTYIVLDEDGNVVTLQPLAGEGQITDVCELLS